MYEANLQTLEKPGPFSLKTNIHSILFKVH